MPEISIIVPVYNAEKYLNRCIESIRAQTFHDYEVLLVNDGSIDNSLAICKEATKKDDRFLVYDKVNEGPGLAREHGLNMSHGKYVFFVDSDDYIEPMCIEKMLKTLVRDNVDLVRCNVVIEYKSHTKKMWQPDFCDKVIRREEICNRIVPLMIAPEKESDFNARLHRGCVCSLFKKEIVTKNGIHFTNLTGGEDALFTMELYLNSESIEFIQDYFYHYEQGNEESLSKTISNVNKSQRSLKREYIKALTQDLSCYEIIQERWQQEDRRMVYLDSRIIVSHMPSMSFSKKLKALKELLDNHDTRIAFKDPIKKDLPFLMYGLYFLIKNRMALLLYLAIKIKRV